MYKTLFKALMLTMILIGFNVTLFSQDFVYDWVRKAGGEGWDLAKDVVIDNKKNVYLTGGFESVAYFGADSLVSKGDRDVFIAKYDSLGTLVWVKAIGGAEYDNAADLQIKGNGNILIAGNFQDTCYFEEQILISDGYMNNFVAEYSPLGNLIHLKNIQADTKADNLIITLNGSDGFFLSGTWYGKMSIESDTLISKGISDMFTARFDSGFIYKGMLHFGGDETNVLKDFDYFDNTFYISSEFNDSIYIGLNRLYSYGSSDVLILKTDTGGNILAMKHLAGFGTDAASSLIMDSDSNIYMSGEFDSRLYLGNDSLVTNGGKDMYLIKTDKNLNTLWLNQIGSNTDEFAKSLCINTADAVYFTGSFIDTLTLGNKTLVSENGTADMFVAKYSKEGEIKGFKQSGGSGFEYDNMLINDSRNYLYIIGNFGYDFAFETDSVSSDSLFNANREDVFIARFFDCDYARYPEIGQDTSFCGYGTIGVLNPEGTGIFGNFRKYKWNSGQKTRFITVSDSGYYYVSTVDSHNCPVKSDSIFVAVYPLPEPDLGPDQSILPGQSLTLSGGIFDTYLWSNGTVQEILSVSYDSLQNYTNSYTLTVTNSYNCTGSDQIELYKEGASYSNGGIIQYQNIQAIMGGEDGGEFNQTQVIENNPQFNPEKKDLISISTCVYPNPNMGKFYVNIDQINEPILIIKIYSLDGKLLYETNCINESPFEISIDSNGTHYLLIETSNRLYFEKIIIQ